MEEQIRTISELGFQGIEHHFPYSAELILLQKKYNLKMIDSYIPFSEADVNMMQELGIRYVVSRIRVQNREDALKAAEALNADGRRMRKYGFKTFFHNMGGEFLIDGDEYLYEILLKNTDPELVCSEMDLGWVICAGADPNYILRKYPGRVELMHVKPTTRIYGAKAVIPDFSKGNRDEIMAGFQKLFREMQGPWSELVRDYREPMETAEACGCMAFVYEREQYYTDDKLGIMREDIAQLRKFW
jgi:sugar phosphate isomerase/epimerase